MDIKEAERLDFETFLTVIYTSLYGIIIITDIIFDKMNDGCFFKEDSFKESQEIISLNHGIRLYAKYLLSLRDSRAKTIINYDDFRNKKNG